MKSIPLTQGKFAIVDDGDYDWLTQWKWCYDAGYAMRNIYSKTGRILKPMHALIMETPKGMDTDHINGDKLDNRRGNLRICTHAENMRNRGKQSDNESGYKGVMKHKNKGKWVANIVVSGKSIYLGIYDNPEKAARAYLLASKEYFGEFSSSR